MRTFIRVFLLVVLVIITPFIILLLSVKFSGVSTHSLKTQLANNRVYEMAITQLNSQIDASIKEGVQDDLLVLLGPIIKKEITPEYIKNKTETLLDDTSAWVQGKRATPPVLSFADLKERLVSQNSQIVATIIDMSRALKQQQEELKTQAKATGENIGDLGNVQMPDVEAIMKSDFSIPLGQHLTFIKNAYVLLDKGLPVLIGMFCALLAIIILLSPTVVSKLHWLSAALFVITLGNIGPLVLAWVIQSVKLPAYVAVYADILLKSLLSKYTQLTAIVMGVFLLVSIFSLIFANITKDKMKK